MRHYSIFDRLATDSLKTAVFRLQTAGAAPAAELGQRADGASTAFAEARELLRSADILVLNGGNPDFLNYVLMHFASPLGALIKERVKAGSLVLGGRSAGPMVVAADWGLSYEAAPGLLRELGGMSTRGLGLAGKCAVRPHYTPDWLLASMAYEKLRSLTVVLLPDGEGLQCLGPSCRMSGATSALVARRNITPPGSLERLALAFGAAGG